MGIQEKIIYTDNGVHPRSGLTKKLSTQTSLLPQIVKEQQEGVA